VNGSYTGHKALMMALFGRSGQPPAWRAQAACSGQDTEVFFDPATTEQAKQTCAGCPVQALCRADQLGWENQARSRRYYAAGTFGDLTGSQRNQLHYPRKSSVTSAPAVSTDRKDVA
jgi:WhiB family redox-sensing transcriptional regulator